MARFRSTQHQRPPQTESYNFKSNGGIENELNDEHDEPMPFIVQMRKKFEESKFMR